MKNNIHKSIPRNIAESLFPKLLFSEVCQLDGMKANFLENVPPHLAEHVVREIREMGCTFFDLVKEDGTSDILYTESTDTELLRQLSEIVTRRAGEAEPPLTMSEHKFLLEAVGFSTDLLTELENEYFGMGPVEDTLTEGVEIYVPREEGFRGDRDWLDAAESIDDIREMAINQLADLFDKAAKVLRQDSSPDSLASIVDLVTGNSQKTLELFGAGGIEPVAEDIGAKVDAKDEPYAEDEYEPTEEELENPLEKPEDSPGAKNEDIDDYKSQDQGGGP